MKKIQGDICWWGSSEEIQNRITRDQLSHSLTTFRSTCIHIQVYICISSLGVPFSTSLSLSLFGCLIPRGEYKALYVHPRIFVPKSR